MVVIVIVCMVFFSSMSWAKEATDQDRIILINDAASALEESDPALSKKLARFADDREKEWDYNNAHKDAPLPTITDKKILAGELKLLNAAAVDMQPAYPLIAQGLGQMIKERVKIVGDTFHDVYADMPQSDFFDIYPKDKLRNLRHNGPDEWMTYNEPIDDPFHGLVTFYFHDGKVTQWKSDDRPEVIKEYLDEFCFYQDPSLIYQAIKDVLLRMPYRDFLNVTNRQRPVLFTEFYVEGTARFASSSEFIVTQDTPPCCKQGFTLVKLGMSLGLAKTPAPIEGVVAHEIAHRVLDSIRKGNVNCDAERAANALIKKWGFGEEFKEASRLFGQKKGDPPACQEAHKTVQ